MTVGKCDDFSFGREHGFTGSAGMKQVSGYMRGGPVKKAAMPQSPGVSPFGRAKPSAAKIVQAAPLASPAPIGPAMRKGGQVKGK